MTTVLTRTYQILARDGFGIVVKNKKTGKRITLGRHGILGPYPFNRKLKDSATVAVWRARFEATYPGYTCDVLKADGKKVSGQTLLGTVRATY